MNKAFEKIIENLEEAKSNVPVNRLLDDIIKDKPKELGQLMAQNKAIELVKQEAEQCKLYDTISIHTNGLEEGIRCAVCTNQIKSDTGCDGGCCVD